MNISQQPIVFFWTLAQPSLNFFFLSLPRLEHFPPWPTNVMALFHCCHYSVQLPLTSPAFSTAYHCCYHNYHSSFPVGKSLPLLPLYDFKNNAFAPTTLWVFLAVVFFLHNFLLMNESPIGLWLVFTHIGWREQFIFTCGLCQRKNGLSDYLLNKYCFRNWRLEH